MKKLISIILSLALVACMFGMSAMAADFTIDANPTNNKNIVGTHGTRKDAADSHLDGDTDFTEKSIEAIVKLNLTEATSRYAVDITFTGALTINVSGLTWDVNELKYVTETATIANQEYNFTVTNYSDKTVTVKAACAVDATAGAAGVGCEFSAVSGDVNGGATVENCVINANTHGAKNATYAAFTATLKSDNWTTTINKLITGKTTGEITLATFTVTISK